MDNHPIFKRVKERSVWEAKASVDQWRKLFKEGVTDQAGKNTKLTLKQAAEYVGIPKKTLEDYHQLLSVNRKVSQITPLESLRDRKMGYLRQFLKENKIKDTFYEQHMEEEEEEEEEVQAFTYNEEQEHYLQQQPQAQPQQDDQWEQMILEGPTTPYNIEWDDYLRHEDRYSYAYAHHSHTHYETELRSSVVNYAVVVLDHVEDTSVDKKLLIIDEDEDFYLTQAETDEED